MPDRRLLRLCLSPHLAQTSLTAYFDDGASTRLYCADSSWYAASVSLLVLTMAAAVQEQGQGFFLLEHWEISLSRYTLLGLRCRVRL
jgi:hypothetical protein